ncbi:probable alanine aminotransferase, mitochondrial isoform X1 [Papaver somniferum]|uniref:probable alanine aminotransferase, mitochondrial isoform X1 n=1 Tax=Papaver somniferum TaxID=3469 RepID=UPI000E6FB2DF|nr:probable alanine aminotransferase, mitochondrial isoform X1 [Papaver somniferum]
MTNSGNYKINKKKRAKSLKEKAKLVMGSHPHRRCEDYQSFEHDDRRQRSRSPQVCSHGLVKTPTSTIVVKGLPKETTEDNIHQILAEWRPLRNVRIMMKKNSSVCRGIAFIDFPSVVAAQKMMDEIGDCGLDVNGLKLSFEYRLGKISELASEDPIVKAGAPDSRDPAELRMLKVGDEPYESYSVENNCVLFSLVRSAKALEDTFNSLEGVTCEKADEGLYLFPRIQFPQKAVKAADAAKIAPDAFYAKRLVQATGIVVLPGSDFGQVPGIWCIGLPILLQKMEIPEIITGLTDYHQAFMAEFHD